MNNINKKVKKFVAHQKVGVISQWDAWLFSTFAIPLSLVGSSSTLGLGFSSLSAFF